jgi:large subunit ribosomal protein L7/L12
MEDITNEQVVGALGHLTVLELIALTKKLEAQWGLQALPQVVQMPSTQVETKVEVQTEFSISLISYPADKKISLVKLVRELLAMGLAESKTLVESVPKLLKDGISKEDVEVMKARLMEAGGVVEIK